MTTGELRMFDTSKLKVVLVCIVLAVVTSGVVFVALTDHATSKHGVAASAGSRCFDNHSSMLRMTNPETKRNADVCFESLFYVYITEANGDPVTIFPKEKLASLDEVVQYLIRVGYQ
jgi:hypothetical protein